MLTKCGTLSELKGRSTASNAKPSMYICTCHSRAGIPIGRCDVSCMAADRMTGETTRALATHRMAPAGANVPAGLPNKIQAGQTADTCYNHACSSTSTRSRTRASTDSRARGHPDTVRPCLPQPCADLALKGGSTRPQAHTCLAPPLRTDALRVRCACGTHSTARQHVRRCGKPRAPRDHPRAGRAAPRSAARRAAPGGRLQAAPPRPLPCRPRSTLGGALRNTPHAPVVLLPAALVQLRRLRVGRRGAIGVCAPGQGRVRLWAAPAGRGRSGRLRRTPWQGRGLRARTARQGSAAACARDQPRQRMGAGMCTQAARLSAGSGWTSGSCTRCGTATTGPG